MKYFFTMLALIIHIQAHASQNDSPKLTSTPSNEKLSISRSCFAELKGIGCGHPKDDREFYVNCVRENFHLVSVGCQTFHQKLYGKINR